MRDAPRAGTSTEHHSTLSHLSAPESEGQAFHAPEQPFPAQDSRKALKVFIDAGIEHIRVRTYDALSGHISDAATRKILIKNNDDIRKLFDASGVAELLAHAGNASSNGHEEIYITGKLSGVVQKVLGRGESILPAAALWSAAKHFLHQDVNKGAEAVGIIDLSASGYMAICVDQHEELKDDLLIVNPRCGAGTGVNLSRIMEKLDIDRNEVDRILADYLGETGKEKRATTPVRADRCGVFSSSATVSDKNQGIPLDYALAVTMKSEVMKASGKMAAGTDVVYLTGGVFRWQYARDCAEDILKTKGVGRIVYDEDQSVMMTGMKYLVATVGDGNFRKQQAAQLRKPDTLLKLPSYTELKEKYEHERLYKRLPNPEIKTVPSDIFVNLPVNVGLDIGSTMAKIIITDAGTGALLFQNSYNNHGDTVDTIKHIFRQLKDRDIDRLKIQNVGITGSGRYQVQKALQTIYPHLAERISVLVENYAHARGSIRFAKDHIDTLKQHGIENVNEDFCLLIDIGGEDTKISIISLKKEELFDNAMNIKCSAGTGSLMDTLKALFSIEDIADAYRMAFEAPQAYGINATCAVFLMENARKMQAEGYSKDEILASCCYAIVENMARSLWEQVEFPENTIALLHGQTMLSDPLPLAVTQRIQEFTSSNTYCLVPPFPGHRACIGLVNGIEDNGLPEIETHCDLDHFIERQFEKKIILCHGAACGDKNARCARTRLNSDDAFGKTSLTLGGCTAVNELVAQKQRGEKIEVPDAYREIWRFIDGRLPKSDEKNRLVIPRSFSVSEHAGFLGKIFEQFGIPVHVDAVQARDVMEGQPMFDIDTCAPNIGATGQFLRLAREPHGMILVPQIDFLPIEGDSVGRTCTTNQGGMLVASHSAAMRYPEARFKLFAISLNATDPQVIADQVYPDFLSIFEHYGVTVSRNELIDAITCAAREYDTLKEEVADRTADFIEEAIDKKLTISIVCAREYVLNPGIYDSHIGKLLKDKGVVALPAYVFEAEPDSQFDYVYWKNPHDILTKANAIANKQLHRILKHQRLSRLIEQIETGQTDTLLSVVTVSTFRCGPDSITHPVLSEITKDVPSLFIQSDGMIAELAHLENRVNTHLNQVKDSLHTELVRKTGEHFSIGVLDSFSLESLQKDTDVVYFPTLNDNRPVASVFRAAGYAVIDNFDDDTYDLETKAKIGRKHVGDTVCVPLAAVFADMLHAVEDFASRKAADDPLVKGRERVVLFIHGGDGPCRQGQYIDICKLNFHRIFGNATGQTDDAQNGHAPVKFLENIATTLHTKRDYLSEIEKWTVIQGFHAIAVKEVLLAILLKGGAGCESHEVFEQFKREYIEMKQTVYELIERNTKPGAVSQSIVDAVERTIPGLGGLAQYFGYGLYNNNGLRKVLKAFGEKWMPRQANGAHNGRDKVNIHVEGEAYLRIAQIDEILKSLIDTIGFDTFNLTYTPLWCYFEYILEARNVLAEQDIEKFEQKISDTHEDGEKKSIKRAIEEKKKAIAATKKTISALRNVLAGPLYKAAGVEIPHPTKNAVEAARPIIPTFRPFGELAPYVGETIEQLNNGVDLVFNVAPEGCMVSSMGEMLSPRMLQQVDNADARIQHLFSTEGEIDEDLLQLSLLKVLKPEGFYGGRKMQDAGYKIQV